MFLAKESFPFTRPLEENWVTVRDELLALPESRFLTWPERELHEGGWEVFGLHAFGERLEANCNACPKTAALVEAIPLMTTAGFSVLRPGTVIKPHVGYSSDVLRCHLGLIVPSDCALEVGGEVRTWREGECLIFDDTVRHSAWNKSTTPRVVLLIDFARPGIHPMMSVPAEVRQTVALAKREQRRTDN
ncbi:MAG: aspartyl/asparaginyl beta-hydroxylase domain-containing protein [Planctomycetota bacterium]